MKIDFIPDAMIFDVDGVLLNVERSFPEVIRLAVETAWGSIYGGTADSPGYTPEHEKIFKRHGAFNDDYDIAWTMLTLAASNGGKNLSDALPSPDELSEELATFSGTVLSWINFRYGTPVPRDPVRKLCAELYFGTDEKSGLYSLEIPMLSFHWRDLPVPVGVYTGRNLPEWDFAKKNLGWQDFPEDKIIHSDTGIYKPSPEGLELLSKRLGCAYPVFFGDTGSDIKAHAAFGKGRFVAIGTLLTEADYIYDDTESAVRDIISLIEEE